MTNRIYTNEKTCPLCHKNKAMFTLSIEGEKIQVCPTCYQIVKIESDRRKTKNIVNDPKYTLDRIYQMLSDSVIEQNHAMQQIALTIYKHIQQKELIRTNALIVGPTGSGKTEVARQVEKYCGKDYPFLLKIFLLIRQLDTKEMIFQKWFNMRMIFLIQIKKKQNERSYS